MKHLFAFILFLGLISSLSADWDYNYLTLEDLLGQSSLVVVAEIKAIEEKIEDGKVSQQIRFTPISVLKGKSDTAEFKYYSAYIPNLCDPPESHYIDSPPGTKYLLFLTQKNGFYESVLGPCGALRVNESSTQNVKWYTDTSKPQRYSDHWKEKPLADVISQINKNAEQAAPSNR